MSILSLQHIDTGYGKRQVLHDVSLEIEQGETVLLIGSNGSGKSTLLKVIYRLLPLWNKQGEILFEGKSIVDHKPYELIDLGIAYIPQSNELFSGLSVRQNLDMSLLHLKSSKEKGKRIEETLETLPLLKDRQKQPAEQLSGGERKLLSLGMGLANRPKLLLLDEPMAGVAPDKTPIITEALQRLKDNGITLLIIEHRIQELFDFAYRVMGLQLGRLTSAPIASVSNAKTFLV